MKNRFLFRVWDKQEKFLITNAGLWGSCWLAADMSLPENYYDSVECGGNDDNICVEITDRFIIEQCTGLSAAKSYRGTRPEDLMIFEHDKVLANGTRYVCDRDMSDARKFVHGGIKDITHSELGRFEFICQWNNNFSCFQFIGENYTEICIDVNNRDFEIIGTIHG